MPRASSRLIDALPLATARLTLRVLDQCYADALAGLLADPVVMRHFPNPMTRAESDAWLSLNRERYDRHGTGMFAVCRGDDWIGNCGIIRRDIDTTCAFELGYHFRRDAWGQGYATEAARACVDLAFRVLGAEDAPMLVALIRPANSPSQRVARRLAFHVDGAVLHAGACHERWLLPRARHAARCAAAS